MEKPPEAAGGGRPMSDEGRAAFDEWKRLVDAGDSDLLIRTAAERLLDIVEPVVADVTQSIERPALDVLLMCRCVVKRAVDAARAIHLLVAEGFPYNALALLRPTCEDLFFVSFLLSLPRDRANRYIVEKAKLEIMEGLLAQEEFFPKMRDRFGETGGPTATTRIAALTSGIEQQKEVLRRLGRDLGWGSQPRPSVKYMARKSGLLTEYEFFYHGSSSSVHASLHHLFRMVWGDPHRGVFSISNNDLQAYYSRFATVYGTWLMEVVLDAATRELQELNEPRQSEAYAIWLATLLVPAVRQNAPGIVTEQELRWEGPGLPGV